MTRPAWRRRLVIFVKEPRPGRVKTRLAAGIGPIPATWWFRHQSARLIRILSRDPRWETVIAVSPDEAGLTSRAWPRHLPRWPQGAGDLGDRMGRALRELGPGPVVIIGADIPEITPHRIAAAFGALGNADAVFGPATDGGYWLIGLRNQPPATLFDGVRWSSATTLSDTVRSLPGKRIALIDTLRDVDTAEDLAQISQRPVRAAPVKVAAPE
ncbi:MAG: TIGR04282 family arsenosugar biosynthesis glycosyltransferase [Pseudomonadota bacterium]